MSASLLAKLLPQPLPAGVDETNEHPGRASLLGTIAMVAAMVQATASMALALAPASALAGVAAEDRWPYVLTVVIGAVALGLVWLWRERPLLAFPILLLWPIPTYFLLRDRVSDLGLAFYGEAIAHYFTGFLIAGAGLCLVWEWAHRRELGWRRWPLVTLCTIGIVALFVCHVRGARLNDRLVMQTIQATGTGALMLAWPVAIYTFWETLRRSRVRLPALILLLPWATRIALAGPAGLYGGAIPSESTTYLSATIVASAFALGLAYHLRVPWWIRLSLGFVLGWICLVLRSLYDNQFGRLDSAVSGLITSFLGFTPPYPGYVSNWVAGVVTVALFLVLLTVASALASTRDREAGKALALMTVGGLGLASPHLAMLVGVGALLLIDSAHERDQVGSDSSSPHHREDLHREIATWAETLGFEPPVGVDGHKLMAAEGQLQGCPVQLRSNEHHGQWDIRVSIGLVPRGKPVVHLDPNARAHARTNANDALSRTHRIRGAARELEAYGETLLTAMAALSKADLRIWSSGALLTMTVRTPTNDISAPALAEVVRVVVSRIVDTSE